VEEALGLWGCWQCFAWQTLLKERGGDDDDCFYYHSWRNNVVVVFGTLSSFLPSFNEWR